MADTLLLNADAAPLSVLPLSAVTWQDSIRYMWMEKVTVLDWYDDWVVKSPSWETKVPAVMMVKDYIRTNKTPRFSKSNVSLRDEYECQYCGIELPTRDSITLDHVYPSSMGGKTCWENIVISCQKCNHSKSNKLIKPKRAPYRPDYYELVAKRKKFPMNIPHPSWEQYL